MDAQSLYVLREILDELKAIREALSPEKAAHPLGPFPVQPMPMPPYPYQPNTSDASGPMETFTGANGHTVTVIHGPGFGFNARAEGWGGLGRGDGGTKV